MITAMSVLSPSEMRLIVYEFCLKVGLSRGGNYKITPPTSKAGFCPRGDTGDPVCLAGGLSMV